MGMEIIVYMINLILTTSTKHHFLCTLLAHTPQWQFVEEEEIIFEQQTSFKGGSDERGVNSDKKMHLSFTDGATTLSPLSPYFSLLMPTSG